MARLGRQHRVTVVQRKALNTSSENELRKQKIQLEKLQKDNDTFKEQLRLAEMDFKAEQATGDYVRELRARYAGYEAEIEAELERSAELDAEIGEATQILEGERTALGKSQTLVRSPESYQRQIATMENKLEKALNGYDVYLTKNAKLRGTIDHLKKERNTFGGLKKRLETELLEQKKSIAEIIDSSNAAYEARDDAQARMTALRERSEKEMQESTMELKELNRVLEQERKLKEFMGVKGRDRAKVSRRERCPALEAMMPPSLNTIGAAMRVCGVRARACPVHVCVLLFCALFFFFSLFLSLSLSFFFSNSIVVPFSFSGVSCRFGPTAPTRQCLFSVSWPCDFCARALALVTTARFSKP